MMVHLFSNLYFYCFENLVFVCMCVCLCACEHSDHGGQKRASYPPELELQMTVGFLIWILGTALGSSGRGDLKL